MKNWNLSKLYLGLDDENFKKDAASLDIKITNLVNLAKNLKSGESLTNLKNFIIALEDMQISATKLLSFVSLSLSTDSTNRELNNAMVMLQQKLVKTTLPFALFEKFVAGLDNLSELIKKDEVLLEYSFMLTEIKENSIHLLSDEEEVLAAELNQSGGSLFSKMQNVLTSTLEVDYNGEIINLSKVRNLAYEDDCKVRKDAYFAELESYKKIEKSVAFALNGIKKEVITMSKKRKYDSPLEETLENSRINKDTKYHNNDDIP